MSAQLLGTPGHSLSDLLENDEYGFVVTSRSQEREMAYVSAPYGGTARKRKINVLDPLTRTLYLTTLPSKQFTALGTANFFWDSDKFTTAPRYESPAYGDLKRDFESLGFVFMLQLTDVLERLQFPRSGWVRREIPLPLCETVGQHCEKVQQASQILARARGWDAQRAGDMGLAHDFCELYSGDPTPFDNMDPEVKYSNERIAFERLAPQMERGAYFLSLWLEYEAQESPLAVGIKNLDKMDASMQAIRYSNQGYAAVEDFFLWTRGKISDPGLLQVYDVMMAERASLSDPYPRYFDLLKTA